MIRQLERLLAPIWQFCTGLLVASADTVGTTTESQVIVETGKAVGSEGLVAGQVVDIKSEGQADQVTVCHPARLVNGVWYTVLPASSPA